MGGQGLYVQTRLLAASTEPGGRPHARGSTDATTTDGAVDLEIRVQAPLWARFDRIEIYANAATAPVNPAAPYLFTATPTLTLLEGDCDPATTDEPGDDFDITTVNVHPSVPGGERQDVTLTVPFAGLTQDTWFAVVVRGSDGVCPPMFPVYPRSLDDGLQPQPRRPARRQRRRARHDGARRRERALPRRGRRARLPAAEPLSPHRLVKVLAAWWLAGAAAAAEPPPAPPVQEGTRLIEALETAPLALVGKIGERASLDRHGWRATLVVESVLSGDAEPGTAIPIAWEELSSARPPRFADGDRVLIALEPLASGSLWRTRFPDVAEYLRVRAVAQRGLAFLHSPSPGSLQYLTHFLALPAAERSGPAGRSHLLALAADGERPLAVSAATRLAERDSGAELEPGRAALALRALARADSDAELASELLRWIERSQPGGLAEPLDQALAAANAPATFALARGLLPGGVGAERLAVLLGSPAAAQRAAAASLASATQRDRLAALARRDPAPEVRRAALRRLATLDGPGALDTLLEAFSDGEAEVRSEAAQLAGGLGADVVPRLRDVALGWPDPAPETAVLALRLSDATAAAPVLRELADEHPDPRVRGLAGLAIGRPLGDVH